MKKLGLANQNSNEKSESKSTQKSEIKENDRKSGENHKVSTQSFPIFNSQSIYYGSIN